MNAKRLVIFLLLLLPFGASAQTVEVVGRNTNTECTDLDQNIGGQWQVANTGETWRITKSAQSWTLRRRADGRFEGEQAWPHYGGVSIRVRAVLNPAATPPTLSFSTAWGCRWGRPRPRVADEDD
ncbi:MAG TPA: hypothetical protein VEC14_11260 [Reyranellaceae bacterium]|nr:hypothetical protein [Reyranellaceae bacterium]